MGRADASYVLKRQNGEPLLSSKRTFAQVVGDVLMLPEPTIRELSGNILAPDELAPPWHQYLAYAAASQHLSGIHEIQLYPVCRTS